MTENFFGKTLASREISQIPGMLEFDIPIHGDNRGWFKENFQKEKMMPLVSQKVFLLKKNCKIM
jgi:dTDP-4-dehydrorhamnose 3,5-epimerase